MLSCGPTRQLLVFRLPWASAGWRLCKKFSAAAVATLCSRRALACVALVAVQATAPCRHVALLWHAGTLGPNLHPHPHPPVPRAWHAHRQDAPAHHLEAAAPVQPSPALEVGRVSGLAQKVLKWGRSQQGQLAGQQEKLWWPSFEGEWHALPHRLQRKRTAEVQFPAWSEPWGQYSKTRAGGRGTKPTKVARFGWRRPESMLASSRRRAVMGSSGASAASAAAAGLVCPAAGPSSSFTATADSWSWAWKTCQRGQDAEDVRCAEASGQAEDALAREAWQPGSQAGPIG